MARQIIFFIILITGSISLFAQKGTITGTVTDAGNGESLIGANVVVHPADTSDNTIITGAMADFDGNFNLPVNPGTYRVKVSFISFESMVKTVTVAAGKTVVANFKMGAAGFKIEEVTVKERANRENEKILLMDRKNAAIMKENIGAREMSDKGVSDVAGGVKKITGVSMVGSKQLFVRGLGDRYNSAQLNGIPLASPDPTKKVIKLDLFPTEVVKVLGVNKVYDAANYADYTGALINIETKDFPDKPFFAVSLGTGVNTQTSFKDFKVSEITGNRFLGFDAKSREDAMHQDLMIYKFNKRITDNVFKTGFGFSNTTSLPFTSLSAMGGKKYEKFGFFASIAYDNSYSTRPDVYKATINKEGTPFTEYTKTKYNYSTLTTGLINAAYTPNSKNKISYNLLVTNSTDDLLSEKTGINYENDEIFVRQAEYENNLLLNNQLLGHHEINGKFDFDWKASMANVKTKLPDKRTSTLKKNENDEYEFYRLNQQETMRFTSMLDENDYNGGLSLKYKLKDEKGNLKFGSQVRYRERAFDVYTYYYDLGGSYYDDLIVTEDNMWEHISGEQFENDNLSAKNGSRYADKYDASLFITSAYSTFTYKVMANLLLSAGLRFEASNMRVWHYPNSIRQDSVAYDMESMDLFPSLNLKYDLSENSNMRFALSRTITRPSFNEKSPSRILQEFGEPMTHGNSNTDESEQNGILTNSYSNNIDWKYEKFPNPGELIAFGLYAKQLINPIEKIAVKSGGNFVYTYKNTKSGMAAGAEIELKKSFNNIFLGLNAAYIYTQIKVDSNAVETNKERALQGASPYLINADIAYQIRYGEDDKNKMKVALVYNIYGKRIYAVGADGIGDAYELPFNTLDLVLKNSFDKKWDLKLAVKNILNPYVTFEQDYYTVAGDLEGQREIFKYKKGINISFSIGYKF